MQKFKSFIAVSVAIALASCGGSGNGGTSTFSGGGGSGSGGGGGTGSGCSLSERQDWVKAVVDEWYFFPDMVDQSVNKADHSTVQSYLDALVAPARAAQRDRDFSYITSIEEENAFLASGSTAAFGIRLSYEEASRRVFLVEAYENAPAFAAGMDRGTEILEIGNDAASAQTVAALWASGGSGAVSNAFGPGDAGVSRYFKFRTADGTEMEAQVVKAEFGVSPLSPRYGAKILDDGGKKVGYINMRNFISNANPQLRDAFADFKAAGVSEVIVDVRYNGGGLVSVAQIFGSLLGQDKTGEQFSRLELRPSKSAENETLLFGGEPSGIGATKIAFIGLEGTASASELLPNAFIPYLGANTALIGTNTYGKPVGQYAFDREQCDDRLRLVTFRTVNRDGQGDYYNGLASVMPKTCAAEDDLTAPLGTESEPAVSVALDFLAGRSCTAIASANSGLTKGRLSAGAVDGMQILQPDQPSAVQAWSPGLY